MALESNVQSKDALIEAFKARPGNIAKFTHPDTGIKILARLGELDLKKTKLIPVFDASKQ
jgi:hypothetical protein